MNIFKYQNYHSRTNPELIRHRYFGKNREVFKRSYFELIIRKLMFQLLLVILKIAFYLFLISLENKKCSYSYNRFNIVIVKGYCFITVHTCMNNALAQSLIEGLLLSPSRTTAPFVLKK